MVSARFDRRGQLAALTVHGTALTLDGTAGFVLYHDLPANFDAWDIDHYTLKTGRRVATAMRLEVREHGPVRAVLRGHAAIGDRSQLTVDYILEAGCPYLRIDAHVDWHEANRLLKFHVPTAYRGRWARFGCPFGSIQRPQLPGGTSDEAMWEVAGSRWAAVTHEDGSGLAICAEAKFGFSCRDGDLGLSLLRSPKLPDPHADMGQHRIRFAIGRHAAHTVGEILGTAAAADALFAPLVLCQSNVPPPAPIEISALGSLVPSWIMPAQGRGCILRLHETNGSAGVAHFRLPGRRTADLVDFMERRIGRPQRIGPRSFALRYGPYQVLSVRIR